MVDRTAEKLCEEIRRRIRRLQSGGTIDSLKEIGADTGRQIGASFVSLKQLAAHYAPEEQTALLLWGTGEREEQIMACFLFPRDMNKEKITQLSTQCLNMEIAGYLGSIYLSGHSQLPVLAEEWLASGIAFRQTAALTALARHLIINKENSLISKDYFQKILEQEYKDPFVRLTAERYRFNL